MLLGEDALAQIRALLIARRHRLGMSQRDVARRMGRASTAVSILESGKPGRGVRPDLTTLALWAAALDYDIDLQFLQR